MAQATRLMRARLLVNLMLLLCAGTLGFWVYYSGGEPAAVPLATVDAAAVQRIELRRRDEQMLSFARRDGGWQMLSPGRFSASDYHLDLVLGLLGKPVAARYRREEVDLAATGLLEPMLVVSFDGREYAFGGLDPLGRRRYIAHGGEVLLVQEGVSAVLASPWWNFVDRRLLPAGEPKLLRHADGHVDVLADKPSQLAHWSRSSASIVRPIPAGRRGEPLELELSSGETLRWQWIGGENPLLLRPDLGLSYEISPAQLDALLGRVQPQATE